VGRRRLPRPDPQGLPVELLRDLWTSSPAALPGPLRGDADDQPALSAHDKEGVQAYVQECRDHLEREERRSATSPSPGPGTC
jgi:DNA helicase-2/ATP-dependent DNA helicase PcrA